MISKGDKNLNWPQEVIVYTDGASRGNPGPASIGIYITDLESAPLLEIGEKLGVQTNNFAEYTAVIRGLKIVHERGVAQVVLRSDSELMVKQMTGQYKVKSPKIVPLHAECLRLVTQFESVRFEHVRRELNTRADHLANLALDTPEF